MEELNFTQVVQTLFKFGPFAILPYLVYLLQKLYKQFRGAPNDLKPVLKRNMVFYQILIIYASTYYHIRGK